MIQTVQDEFQALPDCPWTSGQIDNQGLSPDDGDAAA